MQKNVLGKAPAEPAVLSEHPALQRFLHLHDAGPRLLFITAASGTGRHFFARGWLGGDRGEVLDLSNPDIDLARELDPVVLRLQEEPELRLAVIMAPSKSAWLLAARFDCLLARQHDLVLTPRELGSALGFDADGARDIHEQTGGWLGAARILAASPEHTSAAYQVIHTALHRWLAFHPQAEQIRQAAFLPILGREDVEAFYTRLGELNFSVDELADTGTIVADTAESWRMPQLIRRSLVEQVRMLDPAGAEELELSGLQTVASTHSVQRAVDKAVSRKSWNALSHLMMDRWVDLFLSNPRALRGYLSNVPEFVINQTNYLWVGMRIVAAIGTDRMVLPFPSIAPNHETDRAAQRLAAQTCKLYQRPTSRALSIGLLEVTYLRLAGLYGHSAAAALQLRTATRAANTTRRISPKLVALVEHHCGMSLELEGHDINAKWAYSCALQAAAESGSHFQLADATGRLALLSARQGDHAGARQWLAKHEESIGHVDWGQAMVGRAAALTRASLCLADLDVPGFQAELAKLPAETDSDEFWAMHTLLLAFNAALTGTAHEFGQLLQRLADERVYAQADLSAELVEQSRQLLDLAGCSADAAPEPEHRAAELRALAALRAGQPDRALFLLECSTNKPLAQRCVGLYNYLCMAARQPQGPSADQLELLRQLHASSGQLLDLALLSTVPGWNMVARQLDLDAEALRRIALIQQALPLPEALPELTARELEMLRLLRQGLGRRQIAEKTYRSENTIKTQLRGLYRKLGAADGAEALDRARDAGL